MVMYFFKIKKIKKKQKKIPIWIRFMRSLYAFFPRLPLWLAFGVLQSLTYRFSCCCSIYAGDGYFCVVLICHEL